MYRTQKKIQNELIQHKPNFADWLLVSAEQIKFPTNDIDRNRPSNGSNIVLYQDNLIVSPLVRQPYQIETQYFKTFG